MPEPVIVWNYRLDLPFMRKRRQEEVEAEEECGREADDDDGPTDDEVLEQMEAAVPEGAIALGTLEYHLDHSPGLSWKMEDHFYLIPLKGEKYDWALIRITWDDNWGQYEWVVDAVGSGFSDSRAAARTMVAALFERWGGKEDGEATKARRAFLEEL